MKLKQGFITHDTGSEQIMVDATSRVFSGLVRSNSTAAFIVDCLKKDTTQEKIVDAMLEKYDVSRATVEKDVAAILGRLRSIKALEE